MYILKWWSFEKNSRRRLLTLLSDLRRIFFVAAGGQATAEATAFIIFVCEKFPDAGGWVGVSDGNWTPLLGNGGPAADDCWCWSCWCSDDCWATLEDCCSWWVPLSSAALLICRFDVALLRFMLLVLLLLLGVCWRCSELCCCGCCCVLWWLPSWFTGFAAADIWWCVVLVDIHWSGSGSHGPSLIVDGYKNNIIKIYIYRHKRILFV